MTSKTSMNWYVKEWWPVALISATAFAVGAILVTESRGRAAARFVANLREKNENTTPGLIAFERVLSTGVLDHEVQYLREGMRPMMYFHKAFSDAKALGISPTHLASSGRYFGEKPMPIRIEVYQNGHIELKDGRHRYTAAKEACAQKILADVVLFDSKGNALLERKNALVNLL